MENENSKSTNNSNVAIVALIVIGVLIAAAFLYVKGGFGNRDVLQRDTTVIEKQSDTTSPAPPANSPSVPAQAAPSTEPQQSAPPAESPKDNSSSSAAPNSEGAGSADTNKNPE